MAPSVYQIVAFDRFKIFETALKNVNSLSKRTFISFTELDYVLAYAITRMKMFMQIHISILYTHSWYCNEHFDIIILYIFVYHAHSTILYGTVLYKLNL